MRGRGVAKVEGWQRWRSGEGGGVAEVEEWLEGERMEWWVEEVALQIVGWSSAVVGGECGLG